MDINVTGADGVFHDPQDTSSRHDQGVSSVIVEKMQQRLNTVVRRLESIETAGTDESKSSGSTVYRQAIIRTCTV